MKRLAGVIASTTKNSFLYKAAFTDIYTVQKMPFEQAVEQYAVTGGVPKYLEFFEDGRRLEDQLKDAVLSKSVFLYEEPYFLLKSESVTAVNYFSITKAIADGNHKLGKIAGVLGQETSALTPYLSSVAEIRKAFPGYDVIFGVFCKSGFTQCMLDTAKKNTGLLLINEDYLA